MAWGVNRGSHGLGDKSTLLMGECTVCHDIPDGEGHVE